MMNTYSNLYLVLLICSDLIMVKYIVKLMMIVVQVPFIVLVNNMICDLSHEYKVR